MRWLKWRHYFKLIGLVNCRSNNRREFLILHVVLTMVFTIFKRIKKFSTTDFPKNQPVGSILTRLLHNESFSILKSRQNGPASSLTFRQAKVSYLCIRKQYHKNRKFNSINAIQSATRILKITFPMQDDFNVESRILADETGELKPSLIRT